MAASTSELQVSVLPGELYSYLILVLLKYVEDFTAWKPVGEATMHNMRS
jgi:hypothetical protein